jgi:ketosteroid isomerase-like protein
VAASPLDPYFAAIDAGDVEATAATFADDAVYIRPSLDVPGTLEIARGRDELLDFFSKRGKKPFRHEVRSSVMDGRRCFVEGVAVRDGESRPFSSFLATVTLDDSGLIKRYYALMADIRPELEVAAE